MFKIFFFLWRRPELNPQEFMDYYENHHAPLGISLSPPMDDYRRNYPDWTTSPRPDMGGFDVMTQIWHEQRATFEKQITTMQQSPAKEIIGTDEARFINRAQQLFVTVEERGRAEENPSASRTGSESAAGRVGKFIRFVHAPTQVKLSEFIDGYERDVVPRVDEQLKGLVGYRRNYALFDDPYSFSGGHHNMSKPDQSARLFDLVEEFWVSDESQAKAIDASRERLVAGAVRVKERRSPGGKVMAPIAEL